jgi:hypothetical protein
LEADAGSSASADIATELRHYHGGILSSPAVSQVVHSILSNSEVQVPWTERKTE